MNRIDRLSAVLVMLQSSLSVKPKQIAKRFDISIRTVYRDIRALEETGIPIAGDSRTGYCLVEGFKLPPMMFTQEEAFAFLAAEKLVDKFTGLGLLENYKSGVDKIRAVMRLSEKVSLDIISDKIGMLDFNAPSMSDVQNWLQMLMASITKQCKVEITYHLQNKNKRSIRVVDPIGIFFSMTNWYMIGFCNQRNDYRTFKINRIEQIKETESPIRTKHPPLDSFLKELKEHTKLQEIVIEVSRENLSIINDSKYYQGLVSEVNKTEIIELHFMTFSLEHFARWYMSYIDIATIIYPDDLKQIVGTIISKSVLNK
jgi:Predicted transcriptional regulator